MSDIRVVRMRRQGGKIAQDADIYVGRRCTMGGWNLSASKWANPFTVKEYGLEEALKKYEQYVRDTPELWNNLEELKGKTLGCFCIQEKDCNKGFSEVCHAQILRRLLEEKLVIHKK